MSDITFSQLQSDVAIMAKLDTSDTAVLAAIKRFINSSQEDVNSRENWYWTYGRTTIQTVLDKTAGTVAVAVGGTTVTGTDTAFAAADVGKFIQFSSSDDWYEITAVGGTDSLTIEKAFTPTTAATADTYIIRQMFYALPSTVDDVLTVRQSITPIKLTNTNYRYFDLLDPGSLTDGDPDTYYAWYDATNRVWMLGFYPTPDAVININVRFKLRTTDMSADADVPSMPAKYAKRALFYGAVWRAMAWNRDSSDEKWERRTEAAIEEMRVKGLTRPDAHLILQSPETSGGEPEIPFPADYEGN